MHTFDSSNGSNYQQQLFRHGGSDGGPFIATASFAPEPGSLGLIAAGVAALWGRRRRQHGR